MILDLAVIGAGPYGLSLGAHLAQTGLAYRIFGMPMQYWRKNMPKGMHLKSEGFASNLYDPEGAFTLRHYCEEKGLPYADIGLPVAISTFIGYGMEFQRRFVPTLEQMEIASVRRLGDGFELTAADGETFEARSVVVATGLTHFGYVPPVLADLPRELVTHSSEHHELDGFAGKKVAVLGSGASALDIAALLHEAGAQVELVARASRIAFHSFVQEPRPLWQKLRNPRSGLGLGWRSRLATDAPQLFHRMPMDFRLRVVRTHLGPAPGWFIRERTVGKFPMRLGVEVAAAAERDGTLHLDLAHANGSHSELVADHMIAATGFAVSVSRLRVPQRSAARPYQNRRRYSRSFEKLSDLGSRALHDRCSVSELVRPADPVCLWRGLHSAIIVTTPCGTARSQESFSATDSQRGTGGRLRPPHSITKYICHP